MQQFTKLFIKLLQVFLHKNILLSIIKIYIFSFPVLVSKINGATGFHPGLTPC